MDIQTFKEQNPDYKDVPDVQLADALHAKYYSAVPRDQFLQQVGLADGGGDMSTSMGRADYQKRFMADNPKAGQGAVDAVMKQFDSSAAARTSAATSAVPDKFAQMQSPSATFDAKLNAKLQGKRNGMVPQLPANQQPDNPDVSQHSAPSTFDTVAGNLVGGAINTISGGIASTARMVGATDTADEFDQVKQAVAGRQKELGGDTMTGKVASMVGGVAPVLAVPEDMISQYVANAGLFAKPAFDDTLKQKLAEGYSRPLALAHAAESFGINLFAPTVATRGAGAVFGKLGAAEATGVKGAALGLGQAAAEGAGFSVGSSVIDKGTDVLAGQHNNNAWVNPEDVAVSAAGFGVLRAGHMAGSVAARIAQARAENAQLLQQHIGEIGAASNVDDAISAATKAVNVGPATSADDVAALLQSIRPLEQPSAPTIPANTGMLDSAGHIEPTLGDTAGVPANAGTPAELGSKYVRVTNPDGTTGFTLSEPSAEGAANAAIPAPDNLGTGSTGDPLRPGEIAGERPAPVGSVPERAAQADAVRGPQDADGAVRAVPTVDAQSALGDNWHAFPAESGTLGIPRAEMPQILSEHRGALTNYLNARGIDHEHVEVPAESLKPTQAEFSLDKVNKAIAHEGGERSILTSSDGHVLDGHHQWLAAVEKGEPVKAIRLKAPIRDLLETVKEFPSATAADGAPDAAAPAPAKRPGQDRMNAELAQRTRLEDTIRQAEQNLARRRAQVTPESEVAANVSERPQVPEEAPPASGAQAAREADQSRPAAASDRGDMRNSIQREMETPSSWVIRNKETGEAVLETSDRKKVDALNTKKYEAVPTLQHLGELNDVSSKAGKAMRGEKPSGDEPKSPVVMDEESYLAQNGASRQGFGDAALHRSSSNVGESTKRKAIERQAKLDSELAQRREELRAEYQRKVESGEIRPPTSKEQTDRTAQGDPDSEATQAAQRLQEKIARRKAERESKDTAPDVDDGADIPRAMFNKVRVQHDVWDEEAGHFEPTEVPAHLALKSVREDISNLEAMLKCMGS